MENSLSVRKKSVLSEETCSLSLVANSVLATPDKAQDTRQVLKKLVIKTAALQMSFLLYTHN